MSHGSRFFAVLGLLAISWASPAQALNTPLFKLLSSDVSQLVFKNTDEGASLARALIGREVRGASDLSALETRLSKQDPGTLRVRAELEARLSAVARHGSGASPQTLSELATYYLGTRAGESALGFEFLSVRGSSKIFSAAEARAAVKAAPVPVSPGVEALEAAMPVQRGSIEAGLPASESIVARISSLEDKFVRSLGILSPRKIAFRLSAKKPKVTLADVVDDALLQQQDMAKELEKLAGQYSRRAPLLAGLLRTSAQKIGVSGEASARFAERRPEFEKIIFRDGEYYDEISGYFAKVRGEMGELKVAIRESGFMKKGLNVREAIESMGGPSSTALRGRTIDEAFGENANLLDKELDLLVDGGATWGEVKAYYEVFSVEHFNWKSVMEQAEKTLKIRALIQEELGIPLAKLPKLKIYFMGGVTEEGARALEVMGIEVIGARFKHLAPATGVQSARNLRLLTLRAA